MLKFWRYQKYLLPLQKEIKDIKKMRRKIYNILKKKGTFDLSNIPTYVTVRGFNTPSQTIKIRSVRLNLTKHDIEFLAEGSENWQSETACIYNTTPSIYSGVLYAYEQLNNNYVLN